MRKLRFDGSLFAVLAGAALAVGVAGSARADSLYRWETEGGSIAFTDDAKRIPPRYRDRAKAMPRAGLSSHPRVTPTDPAATRTYAEQLAARLERLRALNQPTPGPKSAMGAASPPQGPVRVRIGEEAGTTIELAPSGTDGPPIVVERRRLRDPESHFTRHDTIVRQGDRILAIVKPRSHVEPPWWADEGELER